MCGIVAYLGNKQAYPILIEGLKRLEYRGYDSAGVALLNGDLTVLKKQGKVSALEQHKEESSLNGKFNMGIAHTRWATHGAPNDINAHPHVSGDGNIALIHNGIIENYASIKEALVELGHTFTSDTDTEVLVHFIEEIKSKQNLSLEEAVRVALTKIVGAYAIVVIDKNEPDKIVGARLSSPLVLGIGEDEFFLASDATPIIKYTNKVIYLEDGEVVTVSRSGDYEIRTLDNKVQVPKISELDLKIDEIEKGGYPHYMLKEIFQQPKTIGESMGGRINSHEAWAMLGGMRQHENRIKQSERIVLTGCGTSWHAAMIAEYLLEDLARIPTEVEYASEFRYRNPIIRENDFIVALSQSGETADTLAAIKLAKEKGAFLYGVVNVIGSSIARETHSGSYIHAGPEIGVASTKAFTSQVTVLALMALHFGKLRGTLSEDYYRKLLASLESVPSKVARILSKDDKIKYIASEIKNASNALYLGRGYNFPVALEGALKLKEISYIHAEGYPAAEMKHGPIALIVENMPVIVIGTNQSAYEKIISNVQEIKARKGKVIAIVTEGEKEITELADYTIEIPRTAEPFTPLLSVLPLQLLS
ncbi:MAG: glutamine--fructose-6-phosphate transaminase (isomerizing), partial [Saprospiraceae bacterium]|nr:glutamine--fructose-6-phosphate transaminase (isomerizing) [Saprospiraceae bacterium]